MNTGMKESELRKLAYSIWEAEGRPFGQAERHWHMAIAQADADDSSSIAGENFAGESFLGNAGASNIIPDERDYTRITDTEIETIEAEGMSTPAQPFDTNTPTAKKERRKKATVSNGELVDGEMVQASPKKRSGRKKSSDNIMV